MLHSASVTLQRISSEEEHCIDNRETAWNPRMVLYVVSEFREIWFTNTEK